MQVAGNRSFDFSQLVLDILIFLACFNFIGRGPVVFFVFCLYAIFKTKGVRWNRTCILYLSLSIFAVIASIIYFDTNEVVKSLMYFLSFIAGYRLVTISKEDAFLIRQLVFFATLGFIAYLAFVGYLNIIVLGHTAGFRLMVNPWNGVETPATIFGLLACVPISYSFYCFFCQKNNILKLLGVVFLVIALWVNMETATRTPFVLMGVVYAVMFLVLFKTQNRRSSVKVVLLIALVVVLWNAFFFTDLSKTILFERFSENRLESSRWDIMKVYLDHMWEYPWGGGFVEKNYHTMSHNFLQEAYDTYGVLFALPLLLVFAGVFVRFIRLAAAKWKNRVSLLFLSLYIGVFLQLMMEPVIVGYPQLIWVYFMVDGFVVSSLAHKRNILFVSA